MFYNRQIYKDENIEEMIKGASTERKKGQLKYGEPHEQPRAAIQRCRTVVGAYLYLKEKRVNEIFINQVDRIGQQLENLENALAKQPRIKKGVNFHKWQPQDLKAKWFEYMDDIYKRADKKGQEFMATTIERFEAEYTDAKLIKQADVDKEKDDKKQKALKLEKDLREHMKVLIPKLKLEWTKAKDWPKPRWNEKNS